MRWIVVLPPITTHVKRPYDIFYLLLLVVTVVRSCLTLEMMPAMRMRKSTPCRHAYVINRHESSLQVHDQQTRVLPTST